MYGAFTCAQGSQPSRTLSSSIRPDRQPPKGPRPTSAHRPDAPDLIPPEPYDGASTKQSYRVLVRAIRDPNPVEDQDRITTQDEVLDAHRANSTATGAISSIHQRGRSFRPPPDERPQPDRKRDPPRSRVHREDMTMNGSVAARLPSCVFRAPAPMLQASTQRRSWMSPSKWATDGRWRSRGDSV